MWVAEDTGHLTEEQMHYDPASTFCIPTSLDGFLGETSPLLLLLF